MEETKKMSMTAEQRIAKVMERNRLVEAQLISLQEERDEARRAIDINLGEAAQRRLEEDEKAARDHEKRIEHLTQMAVRRLGKRELSKGWETWEFIYLESARRRRLLAAAGSKLARPKLVACYSHWKYDWGLAEAACAKMTQAEKLDAETRT